MIEKGNKRKAGELSDPVRKKIRVQNQSQIQVPSSPLSSLSPAEPLSSLSPAEPPSSLSLSSAPSSSSDNWTHDVFPSFRGEDVRRDFLSHIQKEFKRKGITPFNDNEIKRGESIGPELIRAIRGSKIAIILLSRNYTSSKWCLEELVEIMKCREELGQIVMAIFYKVDPSDVKKLTGDFGEVFRKTCEGKTKEDIGRWKQALEKVATIAGYHSSNWDNEAAMIEDIARDASKELIYYAPSSDFDGLVGMRAHMETMQQFLLLGSDEVRIIGIWGPSGIGKSTIARVLFSQHSHEFQHSVFMNDIKKSYRRLGYDEYSTKLKLQKEFMSQILNLEDIKIHHLGVVQDRLKDKRVLVVLDDVDHRSQLDAMAKEARWFGRGSRIIITTQDKKLLNAHGINYIYKVEFPPDDEALEIFCMYAFDQKSPYDGFKELSWEVAKLASNLPLGLRVMGSYFKGMPKQEWQEELPRLKTRLDGEIESILKFSYDALCDEDQALFLHIACFFNGEPIERVEEYLADNFVGVKSRLRVLAEKSLISVDWGYIRMHDLLASLGREIVRKQSIHEPGQRQFLVDAGDICQVLRNGTLGSPSVIGINLKYKRHGREMKISDGAFERMSNVQFLRLDSYDHHPIPYVVESVNYLPPNLRLLHWDFCPITCLPSTFNPEFLVEIIMSQSNYLRKLWEGNKAIRNLKWMNLSFSKNLKELPDLSTATNLKKLDLRYCSSLMELPYSIGNAINLEELDLSGCSNLLGIPSSIGNAIKLEKLHLRGCSNLVGIPSSVWNIVNLRVLDFTDCSSLVKLPSSSGNVITELKELNLGGCTSLRELPSSMENATSLETLNLEGCLLLVKLPSSIGNLRELYLHGCSSLVELPSCLRNSLNLENFTFSGCSSLVELPSFLGNAIHFTEFNLEGCSSLRELPSSIGSLTNVKELYLTGCSSLVELPSSIGNLHMEQLRLKGCSKLKSLPININMESLDFLDLSDCSSLKSFPEISTNIRKLILIGTPIENIPPSIRSWSRLDILHMSYCENLRKPPHAFDSITELHLSDTRIQEIAPWVKEMPRLKKLIIKGCPKLVSIPQLPDSLAIIDAYNCESLERLHCSFKKLDFSFYNSESFNLNFVNCFKLNQEARDLILKTSTKRLAVFPGEAVPTYFTYRAKGRSLSMKLNGFDTHFPTSFRFKACVLLVNVEAGDWECGNITYCIKDKLSGFEVNSGVYPSWYNNSPSFSKKHLFVFEFETTVASGELVCEFDLRYTNQKWEIEECGIRPLETLAPSS